MGAKEFVEDLAVALLNNPFGEGAPVPPFVEEAKGYDGGCLAVPLRTHLYYTEGPGQKVKGSSYLATTCNIIT